MEPNRKRSERRHRIAVSLVALVVLAAVATFIAVKYTRADNILTPTTTTQNEPIPGDPQFSFNTAAAPGWSQGPTDKVSLAMFFDDHSCWAYAHHKPGAVNATAELQKMQNDLKKDRGFTMTPGATVQLTLKTTSGELPYQLYQSSVESNGEIYGGQEFGYIPLTDSYIYIAGYCKNAEQLATIMPALKAITFDSSK